MSIKISLHTDSKTTTDVGKRLDTLIKSEEHYPDTRFVQETLEIVPLLLDRLVKSAISVELRAKLINILTEVQIDHFKQNITDFVIASDADPDIRSHLLYRLVKLKKIPWDTVSSIVTGDHFPLNLRIEAYQSILNMGPPRLKVKTFKYLHTEQASNDLRISFLTSIHAANNAGRRLFAKFYQKLITPTVSEPKIISLLELSATDRFKYQQLYREVSQNPEYSIATRFEAAKSLHLFDEQAAINTILNLLSVDCDDKKTTANIFCWLSERNLHGAEQFAVDILETKQKNWCLAQKNLLTKALRYLQVIDPASAKKLGKKLAIKMSKHSDWDIDQTLYELAVECHLSGRVYSLPKIHQNDLAKRLGVKSLAILKALPANILDKYKHDIEKVIQDDSDYIRYADDTIFTEALLEYTKKYGFNKSMLPHYENIIGTLAGSSSIQCEQILIDLVKLVGHSLPRSLQCKILKKNKSPKNVFLYSGYLYSDDVRLELVNSLFLDRFESNLSLIDSICKGRYGSKLKNKAISNLVRLGDPEALKRVANAPVCFSVDEYISLIASEEPIYVARALSKLASHLTNERAITASLINNTWSEQRKNDLPDLLYECANYLDDKLKARLIRYANDMKKAQSLGIYCPYRYPPRTLKQIIKTHECEKFDTDKPLVFIAMPKEDHNGVFCSYHIQKTFLELFYLGYRTCIYEVSGALELQKAKDDFMKKTNGTAANHIILGAHGSPKMMAFGTLDDITENYDPNECLHVDHIPMLASSSFGELLEQGGSVLSISCANGFGRHYDENNMLNSLRKLFPHALPNGISGMEYSGYFSGLNIPQIDGPLRADFQNISSTLFSGSAMRRYST